MNFIEKLLEQASPKGEGACFRNGSGQLLEESTLDEAIIDLIGDIVGSAVKHAAFGNGDGRPVSSDIEG